MPSALMVSSSFLPGRGGIESYLAELCDELAPHLAVLAPAKRDGKSIPSGLSYPTKGYPGSMLIPTARVVRAIIEEASRQNTNRVLFGTPWPTALLGPRLKDQGLSYAVIVHGAELLVPSVIPGVKRKLATALSQAELLMSVSEFTRAKLRSFLQQSGKPVPQLEVLRARVDLDRFHPKEGSEDVKVRLGLKADQPMILHFGRLVRRKGTARLIRLMESVTEEIPNAVLVIAGTGPEERRLKRLAQKINAEIVFAGRVPEADAPAIYATADVFALPVADRWFGLDIEGLGVVLLEASASGTPAVTGRSGGTPEAIRDGETGFVVDAADKNGFVTAISRLLQDRELASRMSRSGREYVADEFSQRPLPRPLLDWLGVEGERPAIGG